MIVWVQSLKYADRSSLQTGAWVGGREFSKISVGMEDNTGCDDNAADRGNEVDAALVFVHVRHRPAGYLRGQPGGPRQSWAKWARMGP